jgi:hypothetical protein
MRKGAYRPTRLTDRQNVRSEVLTAVEIKHAAYWNLVGVCQSFVERAALCLVSFIFDAEDREPRHVDPPVTAAQRVLGLRMEHSRKNDKGRSSSLAVRG